MYEAIQEDVQRGWLAGAAEIDITPPVGTRLAGYAGRDQPSTHILDPLYAQCLVLQDAAGQRCCLLTADLIGISQETVTQARTRIEATVGIPPERTLIACTHTHAGPGGAGPVKADVPGLVDHLAGVARAATYAIRPALLAVGAGTCESVQLNRRDVTGPIDPDVTALRVQDAVDGHLIAALVNFACHPTILASSQLGISADYPGSVRATVRALCGREAVVLFANGACADINPTKLTQDQTETRRIGTIVGAEAARVLEELRGIHGALVVSTPAQETAGSLTGWGMAPKAVAPGYQRLDRPAMTGVIGTASLPIRAVPAPDELEAQMAQARERCAALPPDDPERRRQRFLLIRLQNERRHAQREASTRDVEVQALGLGQSLVFVTAPGELFVAIGQQVKQALREAGGFPVVISYANDSAGYLPTDDAFDWHGYEIGVSPYDRGTEPALSAAMLEAGRGALDALQP